MDPITVHRRILNLCECPFNQRFKCENLDNVFHIKKNHLQKIIHTYYHMIRWIGLRHLNPIECYETFVETELTPFTVSYVWCYDYLCLHIFVIYLPRLLERSRIFPLVERLTQINSILLLIQFMIWIDVYRHRVTFFKNVCFMMVLFRSKLKEYVLF